ncbi:hypothetical protein ASD24_07155 [Paenibacillus sp. Root52]|nr:hypothetical protein ASD24_07155 [Paenibacillus sp. Root52]
MVITEFSGRRQIGGNISLLEDSKFYHLQKRLVLRHVMAKSMIRVAEKPPVVGTFATHSKADPLVILIMFVGSNGSNGSNEPDTRYWLQLVEV